MFVYFYQLSSPHICAVKEIKHHIFLFNVHLQLQGELESFSFVQNIIKFKCVDV